MKRPKFTRMYTRTSRFVKYISNGFYLQSSFCLYVEEDIENVRFKDPEIIKILINKILKQKSPRTLVVDLKN